MSERSTDGPPIIRQLRKFSLPNFHISPMNFENQFNLEPDETILSFLTKRASLFALFVLQLFCVSFLVTDAVMDITGLEQVFNAADNDTLEYAVVAALVFSLIATGLQIYKLLTRSKAMEDQLKAASGEFASLLDQHFEDWDLTASERDVALLAIKGLEIADIAEVRQTKAGTTKAQLNAIYRKAGVSGRPQLISLFIEELMGSAIINKPAVTT